MSKNVPQDQSSQLKTVQRLQKRAKEASSLLHKQYGSPRHQNKHNPLDELVFIILSLMTTHHSFNRVYKRLKSKIGSWENLYTIEFNELKDTIKDGGLSDQKARRIMAIMVRLKQDFGRATLSPLRKMPNIDAEKYLTSLPGVGIKTAKCVLMYSLDRKVLPVDTHVWRVASRLELISKKTAYLTVHKELEKVVLPEDRYSFHVNSISHGRKVCLALRPKCLSCCLHKICPYPKKPQIPTRY